MASAGGFSIVEYSPDSSMAVVKEITSLLKEGTGLEPESPTEGFADGTEGAPGKGFTVNIRSAELAASVYDDLRTAEQSETKMTFRLVGVGPDKLIDDCEDAWNEYVDSNVTSSLDTSDKVLGSGSAKLVVGAGATAGSILATEALAALDLSARKELSLWVKSSVALSAGDLQLLLDNTPNCASPIESLNLPAIAAATWTKVNLTLATPANLTAVISVGIKMVVDKGAFTLNLDEIRGVATNWVVKNATVIHVDNPQESKKFHAKKITAKAFGSKESDVIVFTA